MHATRRSAILGLAAGLFGLATASAAAKEELRLAYILEPSSQASVYAIEKGKVTSDLIDVSIDYLGIAAIDAAVGAMQYDVVQSSALGIPRAVAKGIPLKAISLTLRYAKESDIINIWVPKDSPVQSMADLKGKTIGAFGLNSSSMNNIRLAIAKKYGMNVSYDGGDFTWVEVPANAMAAALKAERIAAGTFLLSQASQYGKSGEFRAVMNGNRALIDTYGVQLPSGMLIAYDKGLNDKPQVYKELLRMLNESMAYLKAHEDEVFTALAAEHKMKPEDVRYGYYSSERVFGITGADYKALERVWQDYKDIGILDQLPPVDQLVWAPAVTN